MRSLSGKLFVATLGVSIVSLAIGVWWVRRAVNIELDRRLTVQRTEVDSDDAAGRTVRDVDVRVEAFAIAVPGDHAAAAAAALNRRLIVGLSIVVLGAALATALLSRRILVPVRALRRAAERWARGDLGARVDVGGRDELAALGRAFNDMAARLEQQERLKRDLTNDIAHELRTPLTNLRCHVEALQDSVVAAGPGTWATLAADVGSLERIVGDLGELAQADARELALAPEPVPLAGVFDALDREFRPRTAIAALTLDVQPPGDGLAAWVDRGRLQQVLRNLLDNALAHTPAGGRIMLGAEPAPDGVSIRVTDTGVGIDPEHLPRIFDRFYRVDPSRSRRTGGTGLGLAIARQLVLASGGAVHVRSAPREGTTFVVTLPGPPS